MQDRNTVRVFQCKAVVAQAVNFFSKIKMMQCFKVLLLCIILSTGSVFTMHRDVGDLGDFYKKLEYKELSNKLRVANLKKATDLLNTMADFETQLSNDLGGKSSRYLCDGLKKSLFTYENFITKHLADFSVLRKSYGIALSEVEKKAEDVIQNRMRLVRKRVGNSVCDNLVKSLKLNVVNIEKGLEDVSFLLKLGEGRNLLSALYESLLVGNEQAPAMLLRIAELGLVADTEILDSSGDLFSEQSMLFDMLKNFVLENYYGTSDLSRIFSIAINYGYPYGSSKEPVSSSSVQSSLLLLSIILEILKTEKFFLGIEAADCAKKIKVHQIGAFFEKKIHKIDKLTTVLSPDLAVENDRIAEIKSSMELLRVDRAVVDFSAMAQQLAEYSTSDYKKLAEDREYSDRVFVSMHADLEKMAVDLRADAEKASPERLLQVHSLGLLDYAEQSLESAESIQGLLSYKKCIFNRELAMGRSVVADQENAGIYESLCCTFLERLYILVCWGAVQQEDAWNQVAQVFSEAVADERESVSCAGHKLGAALFQRLSVVI